MKRRIRVKELESYLQDVEVFPNPKVKLEQYPTTPYIAAHMLHTIHTQYDDIENKSIADLGVGCGVLCVGCSILGCGYVMGIDIDTAALTACRENLTDLDITNIDLLQYDVSLLGHFKNLHGKFDTVVMNPPFGTKKNPGIDMEFLKAALCLSNTVYSLHKTSTREHVLKQAKSLNVDTEVVAELRFDLSNTLRFHKKKVVDIEVDFIRFNRSELSASASGVT